MSFRPRLAGFQNRSPLAAWRPFLTGVAVGLILLLVVGIASAQPMASAPFDALLRAHVRNGVVDYPGFEGNADFRKYVDSLAKPVRFDGRAAELAWYINAYNALAIEGILQGLSPSSFIGRTRYFKLKEWPVNGQQVSLHDLEHKILRPLHEPRIHFAIVCASKSCPFLRSEAYTPANLDNQLDEQARQFVNDPARNRFDAATRVARLSPIFDWFGEDFAGPAGSTQRYLARFATDPEVARMLAADGFKVEWLAYDWTLNGTPPRL